MRLRKFLRLFYKNGNSLRFLSLNGIALSNNVINRALRKMKLEYFTANRSSYFDPNKPLNTYDYFTSRHSFLNAVGRF